MADLAIAGANGIKNTIDAAHQPKARKCRVQKNSANTAQHGPIKYKYI
jgi:hypothetical protein